MFKPFVLAFHYILQCLFYRCVLNYTNTHVAVMQSKIQIRTNPSHRHMHEHEKSLKKIEERDRARIHAFKLNTVIYWVYLSFLA